MSRLVIVLGAGLACAGLLVFGGRRWLAASAPADSSRGAASQLAGGSAVAPPAAAPRVELAEQEFDFGVFEVGQQGRHGFTVRNVGQAELRLELGSSTCKCTLAELKQETVPPGGSTEIVLAWDAEISQAHFRQGVRIKTNDPQRPEFGLGVLGKVRSRMDIDPTAVYFRELPRKADTSLVVTLYSQTYDDVRVARLETTDPRLKVQLLPAETPLPEDFEARFQRRLVLTYSADDRTGPFHGTVRVFYEAPASGPAAASPFEFHYTGEVSGDVSLEGRAVVGRLLNLGTVSAARGAVERAYLHVRNPPADLKCSFLEAAPAWIQVRVLPAQRLGPTMTRIPIEVSIPKGTASAVLSDRSLGEVRLRTTHPELPQIRFQVAAVVGP